MTGTELSGLLMLFLLKVLHPHCQLHRTLPTEPEPPPDPLADWLTTAA